MCVNERYGRSVVLAWLAVCGCAVVRGSFGSAERALLPKSLRNVRFGSMSVLTYRPPDCLSFPFSFFPPLRFNLKVMKRGGQRHQSKSAAALKGVCWAGRGGGAHPTSESGDTEAAGMRLSSEGTLCETEVHLAEVDVFVLRGSQ